MNRSAVSGTSLLWQALEPSAIAAHATEWDGLVAAARYPAFLRAGFLGQAIRHFGCQHGLLMLGRADGELVVSAVVAPTRWGQWVCYQPSQLPLGAWIMERGCQWQAVLPSMLRALPGHAISLSATQQDPVFAERPVDDPRFEVLDYVQTGWIDVTGTFEDFWQARGKNLRQNLRKQRRKIEEQSGHLAFDYLEAPAAVDAAILEFASLESAGWKAAEGTAVEIDNAQGAFYRSVLADFARRGQAFALRLALDGKVIAVDFGVRDADTLVILKTTYDEDFKACSPAQLLHEQAFERIFQQQLARRIEFYGRLMEWHTRWTEQSRMLYHVNCFRSPALRRLRDALKNLGPARRSGAAAQSAE